MLTIENLHVSIDDKEILKGVSLTIKPGEIHAVMGPNGSGKSTLANSVMGHPAYTITEGSLTMNGVELTELKADKRAQQGLFLAFQYPKEIPGVSVAAFMRMAVNAVRKARGEEPLNPMIFRKLLREHLKNFGLSSAFMNRSINEGFSGGEKKKVEIIQMALLEPKVALLDETDSGLDVDALRAVSEGIVKLATPERGLLLITHYQRILHYVKPQFVHVMMHGKIVMSGDAELGQRIEREGYDWIRQELGIPETHDEIAEEALV
ncbi:Fe-S cluster assembly ATPase SufC [Candidatus Peregrinibacteria bacterium CG_4_9_14_0_2_um_filter_53_11]|nr:MAG: Fe-S cluster assembly ATPase SufC [Candidatus Peregrinibacteria bacterium CG_4_9_14_0_2_um_filter_53_11]